MSFDSWDAEGVIFDSKEHVTELKDIKLCWNKQNYKQIEILDPNFK